MTVYWLAIDLEKLGCQFIFNWYYIKYFQLFQKRYRSSTFVSARTISSQDSSAHIYLAEVVD